MDFSEDFQIIISVPEVDWDLENLKDEPTREYLDHIKLNISETGIPTDSLIHRTVIIGRGADGPALLILFTALTIFLKGKDIKENMEAWISMVKKIPVLLKKISHKSLSYISEPIAAIEAISYITQGVDEIKELEIVNSQIFPIIEEYFLNGTGKKFDVNPERYYVFTILLNSEIHIVIMKSTGKLVHHEKLKNDSWDFHEIDIN